MAQSRQLYTCLGNYMSFFYRVCIHLCRGHECNWAYSLTSNPLRLSVQPIFWQEMAVDLGMSFSLLNKTQSVNYVGLCTGCWLFIPIAKKYGRRCIYILSLAVYLATNFWAARMHSTAEVYVNNLLQGLAGSTNEAIAQITVSAYKWSYFSLALTDPSF